jgi:hypothetical protein
MSEGKMPGRALLRVTDEGRFVTDFHE